jgi:hypothetical protein
MMMMRSVLVSIELSMLVKRDWWRLFTYEHSA